MTTNILIIGYRNSGKTNLLEKLLKFYNVDLNLNKSFKNQLLIKLNNTMETNNKIILDDIKHDFNYSLIKDENITTEKITIELNNENSINFYDLPGININNNDSKILTMYDSYINLNNLIILCLIPSNIDTIRNNILLNYLSKNDKEKETIIIFSKADEIEDKNLQILSKRLMKKTNEINLNKYKQCLSIINNDNENNIFKNMFNSDELNKYLSIQILINLINTEYIDNINNSIELELNQVDDKKINNSNSIKNNTRIIKKLANNLYLDLNDNIDLNVNSYLKLKYLIFMSNNFRHKNFYKDIKIDNIDYENENIYENYNLVKELFIKKNELKDEFKESSELIENLINEFDKIFELHFKMLEPEIFKYYLCLYNYKKDPYDSDYEESKDYDFIRMFTSLRKFCINNTIKTILNYEIKI